MDEIDEHARSSPLESPATNITTPDVVSGDDDDIWASDDNHDTSHATNASSNNRDALLSDLPTIKRQHMTDGYREGLSIGKAKVMQTGFDDGYPIGVAIAMRVGKVLGCIEGILAAKDVSDEIKVAVRKLLNQAKNELAITTLLKGMNDQDIVGFQAVPSSIDIVLSKWEDMILEPTKANGDTQETSFHYNSPKCESTNLSKSLTATGILLTVLQPQQTTSRHITEMVRYRGISINVVSQFDAQRLPEYSTARSFDARGRIAACYIATQPGAQIWFEYSIDGPHPDKAAYFFKLLIDGQVVTSWDCTAKHEYCGKTVFLLHTTISHPAGPKIVLQRSIAFTNLNGSKSPRAAADCIEIRVHRIEHRRRLRDLPIDTTILKSSRGQGALKIVDHGPIELGRPARKYQYQLLDPKDEPYACFRFYCRTQEYLRRHQILDIDQSSISTSLDTPSSGYFDALSSPARRQESGLNSPQHTPSTPTKIHTLNHNVENTSCLKKTITKSPSKVISPRNEAFPIIKLKGSIEDLPSNVPRSPQSAKPSPSRHNQNDVLSSPTRRSSPLIPDALKILKIPKRRSPTKFLNHNESPSILVSSSQDPATKPFPPPKFNIGYSSQHLIGSPTPIRPSHQRHKPSHLKLTLDDSSYLPDPTLEPKDRRPLSPFTPSGLLRKISSTSAIQSRRSVTPHTALVVPTVNEVDEVMMKADDRGRIEREVESATGTPTIEKSDGTPGKVKVKQIYSLWTAGRSGWTRRPKVERED